MYILHCPKCTFASQMTLLYFTFFRDKGSIMSTSASYEKNLWSITLPAFAAKWELEYGRNQRELFRLCTPYLILWVQCIPTAGIWTWCCPQPCSFLRKYCYLVHFPSNHLKGKPKPHSLSNWAFTSCFFLKDCLSFFFFCEGGEIKVILK